MQEPSLIESALLLKKTALFSREELDFLLCLAEKIEYQWFEKGKHVFQITQKASLFFIVAKGQIAIKDERGYPLGTVGEQDFFGEESLIHGQARTYTAQCKTDCLLLTLTQAQLLAVIEESSSVAMELLRCYAEVTVFRNREGTSFLS
ncbi:MAG: hypothetical protein CMO81_08535 [Waddliaceae bacterium]|nr:hypothetical protein [Waddliaceae bacterium]